MTINTHYKKTKNYHYLTARNATASTGISKGICFTLTNTGPETKLGVDATPPQS